MSSELVDEVPNLTREALEQRVAELEDMVSEQSKIIDAQRKKMSALVDIVIGEERDLSDKQLDIQDSIIDRLDGQETMAETAMAVARSEADISKGTKKGAAKRAAKAEIVKRCASGKHRKASLQVSELIDLARPTHEIQHVEAMRVLKELEANWRCFEFVDGTKKKDGPNDRLKADGDSLPPELVRAAMREYANEDLTYRVSSQLLDAGGG